MKRTPHASLFSEASGANIESGISPAVQKSCCVTTHLVQSVSTRYKIDDSSSFPCETVNNYESILSVIFFLITEIRD